MKLSLQLGEISLIAGVVVSKVIDMVLEGFEIAGLTTLISTPLALLVIITAVIDYIANITPILKLEVHTNTKIE